jgi:Lhr-like helicase
MTDRPFTDEMVRHALTTVQTQHGIIKYAEAMAQVLAEAGRASKKATGDSVEYAVNKWAEIIRQRALELVREDTRALREKYQDQLKAQLAQQKQRYEPD